jgi:hypothetical protein
MLQVASFFLMLGCSLAAFAQTSADPVRMIRSLSGPSGKVIGPKFVLDEIRNRFVYPHDSSLTVYFECRAPKGDFILNAYWKDPQGRTAGISPDLKVQTTNEELNSYWVLLLDANKAAGIWTVELRANGQPVGTHSFELVVPETPKSPGVETPAAPSLDEIYRSGIKSLVWVHKLDAAGHQMDTSTGFVISAGSVLTAFQSIDSAMKLEIEFSDGNRSATDQILACNRLQDWALIKAETRDVPPFQIGKTESIVVGEQAIVFSVGSGVSRTIGAVDISGRGSIAGFGDRINIEPQLRLRAIGGPLLDHFGKVIGIIGGNLAPGLWLDHNKLSADVALTNPGNFAISATPFSLVTLQAKYSETTLKNLLESGVLTPPLSKTAAFNFGGITDSVGADYSYTARSRFSRSSPKVSIYTVWRGDQKIDKGVISMSIYDAANRVRSKVKPQSLKLMPNRLTRYLYDFSPADLQPGLYRIDLFWNDLPIWRASIFITD